MKKISSLILALVSVGSIQAQAVIYGNTDDRHEVYESPSQVQTLARSVAIRVLKSYLNYDGKINATYQLNGGELGKEYCSNIRFADQVRGGPHACTGFLVQEDLLISAGHCYFDLVNDCNDYVWAFDYALKGAGDRTYASIPGRNIYTCKKVVRQRVEGFGAVDYTVVQLDRKVADRAPLQLDLTSGLIKGLPIFIIGFPSGLPSKYTDNSTILELPDAQQFITDTDAFRGNSGSPVFDATTNKVIGIVSGGQNDYVRTSNTCKEVKVCKPEDKCVMSKMSRVSNILTDPSLKGILYP